MNRLDMDALGDLFADDIVFRLPFAPEPVPQRTEGKAAVLELYAGFPSLVSPLGFHDIDIQPLADEGKYVAEYRWDCTMLPTGAPYRNAYIGRFTVREGGSPSSPSSSTWSSSRRSGARSRGAPHEHRRTARPLLRQGLRRRSLGRAVGRRRSTSSPRSPRRRSRRCRRPRRRTSTPPSPPHAGRSTRGRGRAWRPPSGQRCCCASRRDRRALPAMEASFTEEIGAPLHLPGLPRQRDRDVGRRGHAARALAFEERRTWDGGEAVIVNEPVGVVGTVIPWNGPVATASLKIVAALAAGCTIVLKPAPEGPVTPLLLAEDRGSGLPKGVVNMLPAGREVGEHLVRHRDVDKVSFTGSTEAGRRMVSLCGERIARVTLELGGKSAAVIAGRHRPRQVLVDDSCRTTSRNRVRCARRSRASWCSREAPRRAAWTARRRDAAADASRRPARPRHDDRPVRRPSVSATASRATSRRARMRARRS